MEDPSVKQWNAVLKRALSLAVSGIENDEIFISLYGLIKRFVKIA